MGLEPTSRRATTCFQDRLLIQPDDFRLQAAGVGIEPTASWFRARRHYQQQLPRIVLVSMTTSCVRGSYRAAGAGIEPAASWFKAKRHYQQRLPRIGKSALRESNPPRQFGRLEPLPLGQGHIFLKRKERESNPQGCYARPLSRRLPSPVGLPFRCELRRQESNLRRDG